MRIALWFVAAKYLALEPASRCPFSLNLTVLKLNAAATRALFLPTILTALFVFTYCFAMPLLTRSARLF